MLHPVQEWVAHGDYGIHDPGLIMVVHNSKSPQKSFPGGPGHYPDDPSLDAVGSYDGRPVDSVMWIMKTATGQFEYDYALYAKGNMRLILTERKTREWLDKFLIWLRSQKCCPCCKEAFGITNYHHGWWAGD